MPDAEKKRSAIPVLRGSTITHPVRGAPSEKSHGNPARVCSRRRPVAHVTRGFTSRMKHSIEFDQLFDVTVAMEIDLESLDTGRFSVAHQVGSNLGGRTVPG